MQFPTHEQLLQCIQAFYPDVAADINDGVCFGLVQMRRRAFFSHDSLTFKNRLRIIKSIIWPKIEKAMTEVENENPDITSDLKNFFSQLNMKVASQFPYSQWHDCYAFFDGVLLYQKPQLFLTIFKQKPFPIQFTLPAKSILRPIGLNSMSRTAVSDCKGDDRVNHVFSNTYTVQTYSSFFSLFDGALNDFAYPVSVVVNTGAHTFILDYEQGLWTFTDANYLEESDTQYSLKEVLVLILKYYPEPLVLTIKPSIASSLPPEAIDHFNDIISGLTRNKKWLEIHQINKENASTENDDGYNLSCLAAANNDLRALQQCITVGGEISKMSSAEQIPLILASQNGHTEVIRTLLPVLKAQGTDLHAQTSKGITALYIACQNGHLDVVKLLIPALKEQEANLDLQCLDTGKSPLSAACYYGHAEIVIELLNAQVNIELTSHDGLTPLRDAIKNEHFDVITILIIALKMKDENHPQLQQLGTLLVWAAERGEHTLVKELLPIIPIDDLNDAVESMGVTPLYMACQNGHVRVVKELIATPSQLTHLNLPNDSGITPLYAACQFGHLEVAQILVETGIDPMHPIANGVSPLEIAYENGHVDLVRSLVAMLKAQNKLYLLQHDKIMAFFLGAVEVGELDLIKELLPILKSFQISLKQLHPKVNTMALYLAVQSGRMDVTQALLANQANQKPVNLYVSDLLDDARKMKREKELLELFMRKNIGAVVEGFTLLHVALFYGHQDVFNLLLQYSPSLETEVQGVTLYELAQAMDKRHMLLQPKFNQQSLQVNKKRLHTGFVQEAGWTPRLWQQQAYCDAKKKVRTTSNSVFDRSSRYSDNTNNFSNS